MKSMTYEQWIQKVNQYLPMDVDDLPDCNYRDWYDEGMSPASAARKAMRNAME